MKFDSKNVNITIFGLLIIKPLIIERISYKQNNKQHHIKTNNS